MINPLETRLKPEGSRDIKSNETADRDANGQMAGGNPDDDQEPLSDDELERVLEKLRRNSSVQGKGLLVKLLVSQSKRFVLIQEPLGRIIRRIPESELRIILQMDSDSTKGQLLNKST